MVAFVFLFGQSYEICKKNTKEKHFFFKGPSLQGEGSPFIVRKLSF